MQREERYAIPLVSKWLLDAAAFVAPPALRTEWKREWLWELWHGHATLVREGSTPGRASRRLARFALGAFFDAADLRREQLQTNWDQRTRARDPIVCLAALLTAFLALAGWTGGFRHVRTALASPYPHTEQLVLLSGMQVPANSAQVSTWLVSRTWLGDVAGFVLRGNTLEVTPNFFSVLDSEPLAAFQFLGYHVAAVRLLDTTRPPAGFSGAIVRLKHPQDRKTAEAYFGRFGILGRPPVTATFLRQQNRWPMYFSAAWSLLFLAAGAIKGRRSARSLAFYLAKTGLLLGTVAAAWAEVATALPVPILGGVAPGMAPALTLLFLLAQGFVMRWSLEDQAGRCPVCCRRVSMPMSVGTTASLLLDRPGVEFLCTRGHGTLLLSDLKTCTAEPSRWTPADYSWRQMFARAKTA